MRARWSNLRLTIAVCCLCLCVDLAFAPAVAAASAESAGEMASILERGKQLERERRWADALTHYEDAVRHHPAHRELTDRLSLAKAHFDVERRYADSGFLTSLAALKQRESLDT